MVRRCPGVPFSLLYGDDDEESLLQDAVSGDQRRVLAADVGPLSVPDTRYYVCVLGICDRVETTG